MDTALQNKDMPDDALKIMLYMQNDTCFYAMKRTCKRLNQLCTNIEDEQINFIKKCVAASEDELDEFFKSKDPYVQLFFKKICKEFTVDYTCENIERILNRIGLSWTNYFPQKNKSMIAARMTVECRFKEQKKYQEILPKILPIQPCQDGEHKMVKAYLEHGVSPNFTDEKTQPPLFTAFKNSDVAMVTLLLSYGTDPKLCDSEGNTVLHQMPWSNISLVKTLIEAGANVYAKNNKGTTIFDAAIKDNSQAAVDFLLDDHYFNINDKNEYGKTPLCSSLRHKRDKIAQLLINRGANVNIPDQWGNTPIIIAVGNNFFKITKQLIGYGANPYVTDEEGNGLLHLAAQLESVAIIKFLLNNTKLSVNALNENNETPLIVALDHKKKDNALLLIKKNANIDTKRKSTKHVRYSIDTEGTTPLLIAAYYEFLEVMEQILIKKIVDVNYKNADGNTALIFAAEHGYLHIVEFLFKHGADINIKNKDGHTAVALSVFYNKNDVAHFLIENGADLHEKYNYSDYIVKHDNNTLFHIAVLLNNIEVIEALIRKQCNINAKNGENKTSLMLAMEQRCIRKLEYAWHTTRKDYERQAEIAYNIVELLCQNNADVNDGYPLLQAIKNYTDEDKNYRAIDFITLLCKHGANVNIDYEGVPLIKKVKQYQELYDLLIQYGAKKSSKHSSRMQFLWNILQIAKGLFVCTCKFFILSFFIASFTMGCANMIDHIFNMLYHIFSG